MLTIAILSQKGGSGKTTLAVNLAVAAQRKKKDCVVIDVDPQASATAWGDSRDDESPIVISAQASRIEKILDDCRRHQADMVIIDTAPHAENAALVAARAADIVLIPCRPSVVDLRAISASANIAQLAGKDAFVVLNQVPARGTLADEAAEALAHEGVSLAPVRLGSRIAYVHAFTAGKGVVEFEPRSIASSEIDQLYRFIKKTKKETTHGQEKHTQRRSA